MGFKQFLDTKREGFRESVYKSDIPPFSWVAYRFFVVPPREYQSTFTHKGGLDESVRRFNQALNPTADEKERLVNDVEKKKQKIRNNHDRILAIAEAIYNQGCQDALDEFRNITSESDWDAMSEPIAYKFGKTIRSLWNDYSKRASDSEKKAKRAVQNLMIGKKLMTRRIANKYGPQAKDNYNAIIDSIEDTSKEVYRQLSTEYGDEIKREADVFQLKEQLDGLDLRGFLEELSEMVKGAAGDLKRVEDSITGKIKDRAPKLVYKQKKVEAK